MNNAPKRIYANPEAAGPCKGWDFEGWWHVDPSIGHVKYVRADIADDMLEALDTVAEHLFAAASEAFELTNHIQGARESFAARIKVFRQARAVIAKAKGGDA